VKPFHRIPNLAFVSRNRNSKRNNGRSHLHVPTTQPINNQGLDWSKDNEGRWQYVTPDGQKAYIAKPVDNSWLLLQQDFDGIEVEVGRVSGTAFIDAVTSASLVVARVERHRARALDARAYFGTTRKPTNGFPEYLFTVDQATEVEIYDLDALTAEDYQLHLLDGKKTWNTSHVVAGWTDPKDKIGQTTLIDHGNGLFVYSQYDERLKAEPWSATDCRDIVLTSKTPLEALREAQERFLRQVNSSRQIARTNKKQDLGLRF
jgi:hypothetical protein